MAHAAKLLDVGPGGRVGHEPHAQLAQDAIGVEHDRGRLFVAGGMTGKAFVYNARTGALVREVPLPTGGGATFELRIPQRRSEVPAIT